MAQKARSRIERGWGTGYDDTRAMLTTGRPEVRCLLGIGFDNQWIAADLKCDISGSGIQIADAIIGDDGHCADDICNLQSDNVGAKRRSVLGTLPGARYAGGLRFDLRRPNNSFGLGAIFEFIRFYGQK